MTYYGEALSVKHSLKVNGIAMSVQGTRWSVIYTRPNCERKVAHDIKRLGGEVYLPIQRVVRQWSDRKKTILRPLFPCYVFVQVDEHTKVILYSVKSIVRQVAIDGVPVSVPHSEIQKVQNLLIALDDLRPDQWVHEGQRVAIAHGQFAGLECAVVEGSSENRMWIKVQSAQGELSFRISASNVALIR